MSGLQRFSIALLFLLGGALIVFGVFQLFALAERVAAAERPLPHISQPQRAVVTEPPPRLMGQQPVVAITPPIPQAWITYTDTACIYVSTLGGIAVLPKRAGGC